MSPRYYYRRDFLCVLYCARAATHDRVFQRPCFAFFFLDVFYVDGSIFKGDMRLPPNKEDLKTIVHEKLGGGGNRSTEDGHFTFKETLLVIHAFLMSCIMMTSLLRHSSTSNKQTSNGLFLPPLWLYPNEAEPHMHMRRHTETHVHTCTHIHA